MRSKVKIIFFLILFSGFLGWGESSLAANYPLEIIQPQAGLNTLNRFYKAYPGIEYNVRLAVIGGQYPFVYSLTAAPSGMVIDAKKGEISWSNPTESAIPYGVTARVVDAEGSARTVSWTILVTASGFIFMDAAAPDGGDGTINSPFNEIIDWHKGITSDASYQNYFIYWKNGTYGVIKEGTNNWFRVGMSKPGVWINYPGHSPVIDLAQGYVNLDLGDNRYFDGIEFNVNGNDRGTGFRIASGASNVTFRKTKIHGISNGYIGGNNALIMITASGKGNYWSFQDNIGYDVNMGYWLLGYEANKVLVENNHIYNVNGHPIGPKEATTMWFIRGNRMTATNPSDSIGLQYADHATRGISGDIEIVHNFVGVSGGNVLINSNQTPAGGPVYVFRNTFLGPLVRVRQVTSANGPFYFTDNVIVNETPYDEKIQRTEISDPSRLIINNNLTGSPAAGITDGNGLLAGTYANYVGSRGWQLADGSTPYNLSSGDAVAPAAPSGFVVQ